MDTSGIARAFATLGHPYRLAVFRLLMRFFPRGVRPTEIAAALSFRQNTRSLHLADLAGVGPVTCTRRGSSLFYRADLPATRAVPDHFALDTGRAWADLLAPLMPPEPEIPAMRDTDFDVLFICSGNSARSIFAEALLRDLGRGKFQSFSAGTRPNSELNPFATEVLHRNGHRTDAMRAKHVSEYQQPGVPVMDFVFTVCDTAAAEECPPWPGQPVTGHWGMKDPAKATGTDAEKGLAFTQTYAELRRRIIAFVALPFATLDKLALQSQVDRLSLTERGQDA